MSNNCDKEEGKLSTIPNQGTYLTSMPSSTRTLMTDSGTRLLSSRRTSARGRLIPDVGMSSSITSGGEGRPLAAKALAPAKADAFLDGGPAIVTLERILLAEEAMDEPSCALLVDGSGGFEKPRTLMVTFTFGEH